MILATLLFTLAVGAANGASDQHTEGSGLAVVKRSYDLQTQETGYYNPVHDYHGGHLGYGQDYNHHGVQGHRGNEGYKDVTGHFGAKHGSHGNSKDLGYFDKGGSLYKGNELNDFYKGGFSSGQEGNKGHLSGSKGHANKGHKDKGYKNVHHKEEYGFTKYFVDDSDKKHYHNDYDNSDAYFKSGKAGGQKGNKYIDNHNHKKYGSEGHDEKGLYNDDFKTAKGSYGQNSNYGHKDSYGKGANSGGKSASGYNGHHGNFIAHPHVPVYAPQQGYGGQHFDTLGYGHQNGYGPQHGYALQNGYGSQHGGYAPPLGYRGHFVQHPPTGYGSSHRNGYGSGFGHGYDRFQPVHGFGHGFDQGYGGVFRNQAIRPHGPGISYSRSYGH